VSVAKPGAELKGKRVLVVGLARTGVPTALFCVDHGARVTAADSGAEAQFAEAAATLARAGVSF